MANRFVRIGLSAVILAVAVLIQDSSKLISPGAAAAEDGGLQVVDLAIVLLFSAIGLAGLVLLQAALVPGALPPVVRVALSHMANYMGGYVRREINDLGF